MDESSRSIAPALVALSAGLLAVLGSLLPWAVVDETLRSGIVVRDVVRGGELADGRLTFAFAWVAVAMVVSALLPPKAGWWMALGVLGAFLSTLLLTALNLGDLAGFAADPEEASVAPGVGLILSLLSSVLGLGAAGWMLAATRHEWRPWLGLALAPIAPKGDAPAEDVEGAPASGAMGWDERRVYPAGAALASAVLAAIGSLAPWATLSVQLGRGAGLNTTIISGAETGSGRVALSLSMVAAGVLVLRLVRPATGSWSLWVALVSMALAAFLAGLNWANVEGLITEDGARFEQFIDAGWGIVLATVASAIGVGCCLWGVAEVASAPKSSTVPPAPPPPGSTPLFGP